MRYDLKTKTKTNKQKKKKHVAVILWNAFVPEKVILRAHNWTHFWSMIPRAHNWTHYWSMIPRTKRVGFDLGSRAQKFRVKINRLAGQLIAAKAFAIVLKRK